VAAPRSLEDNFEAQLAELRARRSALEGLSDPALLNRKVAAIAAIDAFIAEVERARASYESQKP